MGILSEMLLEALTKCTSYNSVTALCEAAKILDVLKLPKKLSFRIFRYLPYVDLEYVAKAVDKLFLEAFGIPWNQLDKLYYTKMRPGAFDKNFRQYFGWHHVEHIGDLSYKDFKDGGASFSFLEVYCPR